MQLELISCVIFARGLKQFFFFRLFSALIRLVFGVFSLVLCAASLKSNWILSIRKCVITFILYALAQVVLGIKPFLHTLKSKSKQLNWERAKKNECEIFCFFFRLLEFICVLLINRLLPIERWDFFDGPMQKPNIWY